MHLTGMRLWLPYSILGLCVGWTAACFASNPLVAVTPWRASAAAAFIAAAACGLAGALVPWVWQTSRPRLRFAMMMLAAGALSGALTGWFVHALHPGTTYGPSPDEALWVGAVTGVAGMALLLPAFALLRSAAMKPRHARRGSLAAGSEQRRAWVVLLASATIASFASLPDALTTAAGRGDWNWQIDAIWALIATAIVTFTLAEAQVLSHLRAARRALTTMERYAEDPRRSTATHYVDLGVGDDARATTVQADPYRSAMRIETLVHGDVTLSRQLVIDALKRCGVCLTLLVVAAACTHAAAIPSVAFRVLEWRCHDGNATACLFALSMADEQRLIVTIDRRSRIAAQSCFRDGLYHFCAPDQ